MSSPQMIKTQERQIPSAGTVDMKLEVVVLPVADVDRALGFYGSSLGWRVDADFVVGDAFRAVQITPPGSPCSIHFGKGITAAAPGSSQGMYLIVDDLEAARAELIGKGVEVSEPIHYDAVGGPALPGVHPEHRSYGSYASFKDPDGNGWLLQEVTSRLPGRGLSLDVTTLTELLRETEQEHGKYEATAPKHHWSDWYGGYIAARERGRTPEDAAKDAALQVERARG